MGTGAEEMNQPLKADLEKPAALTAVMGRATPSFKEQESFKTYEQELYLWTALHIMHSLL